MDMKSMVYSSQGEHRDALALTRKALAIRAQVLGADHPETMQSY